MKNILKYVGENHNIKMEKTNIYTKIVKVLESEPNYSKPLILVEHSDDPKIDSTEKYT